MCKVRTGCYKSRGMMSRRGGVQSRPTKKNVSSETNDPPALPFKRQAADIVVVQVCECDRLVQGEA